ncbi:MAG: S9 family peptidase [Candidatus Marinimicrobia bacterium]|nr:S9 family peptidase [Candidatus Neomarinimicrobiota bacterium]
MKKQFVRADDIYNLYYPSDPQISADGDNIVFVKKWIHKSDNKYYSNIRLLKISNKKEEPLSKGNQVDYSPQWHPSKNEIIFIRKKENISFLMSISLKSKKENIISEFKTGELKKISYSPDGKHIGILLHQFSNETRFDKNNKQKVPVVREIDRLYYRLDGEGFRDSNNTQLYLLRTTNNKLQKITDASEDISNFTWSNDSGKIAYTYNANSNPDRNMEESDIFIYDLKKRDSKKLNKKKGPVGFLKFSSDNNFLYFSGHFNIKNSWGAENMQIFRISLQTGNVKPMTESLDRTTEMLTLGDISPIFTMQEPVIDSQDNMYFTISSNGGNPLLKLSLTTLEISQIVGGKHSIVSYSADSNVNSFVFHLTDLEFPDEFYHLNFKDKSFKKITSINEKFSKSRKYKIPEVVDVKNGSTTIQAFLLKPPDFDSDKKYPLLLNIHGGPRCQYGYNWFHEMHYFASNGYIVLYANPRGSQGFGKKFADAITGKWADPAYSDLMKCVKHVSKEKYVDKKNMFVTGGSYGGYMTNWIVTQTNKFRGAVTQRSISNLISFFGTSDFGWDLATEFKRPPWKQRRIYNKYSPIKYAKKIKTPLMIIHSENDLRCPIEQAEQLFVRLKWDKKDVKFVRFPEEPHGLSRSGTPDRRVKRLELMLNWFEQHRKK